MMAIKAKKKTRRKYTRRKKAFKSFRERIKAVVEKETAKAFKKLMRGL